MSRSRMIFARFAALVTALAASLMAVGYAPTVRHAGSEAVPAMLAGIAIAVLASLLGSIPVFRARHKTHLDAWPAAVQAMALRLGLALVLGLAVAWTTELAVKPLLLWLAISHAALLIPDTWLGIQVLAQRILAEDS